VKPEKKNPQKKTLRASVNLCFAKLLGVLFSSRKMRAKLLPLNPCRNESLGVVYLKLKLLLKDGRLRGNFVGGRENH
jgi:hypothetical protein